MHKVRVISHTLKEFIKLNMQWIKCGIRVRIKIAEDVRNTSFNYRSVMIMLKLMSQDWCFTVGKLSKETARLLNLFLTSVCCAPVCWTKME